MGKVCVCGAAAVEVDYQARTVKVDGKTFKEGDWMSIDGTGRARSTPGQVKTAPSEIVAGLINGDEAAKKTEKFKHFQQLMKWCSDASAMYVRPTPDTPEQTENAVAFGAVGIGLSRTEHMFFEGDRIDAMREMILAGDRGARKARSAKLLPYQREDFAGIFRALKGYPATIRFLDPPLHEFLPHTKQQQEELAEEDRRAGRAHPPARRAAARVQPDARLPRLPPRHRLPGDLGDAGARRVRGGGAGAEGRHQGPARDHDPAGRLQEGARPADRGRAPGGARRCRRRRR
jgi:pyruvate,orthophosphate dikinase